jgi:hypothetical protein
MNGVTLDEITQGTGVPVLTISNPEANVTWFGKHQITWQASDPAGKRLSFRILYSPNGGSKWVPIATKLTGSSYEVDISTLPPSNQAMIRIIASNGFNSTTADSALFNVVKTPPKVAIFSPVAGGEYYTNSSLVFKGSAIDASGEEIPDNQTYWEYNGVNFGSGKVLINNLPVGTYEITFGAFDSNNMTAEAKITIKILASVSEAESENSSSISSSILTSSIPGFEMMSLGTMFVLGVLSKRRWQKLF